MSDLIDRQAAIDAMCDNCDHVQAVCPHYPCKQYIAVEKLPSAQPEIIKCKDCKWYGRVDKRRFYRGMDCMQKRIDTIVPDRDFCSRAERSNANG